MEMPRKIKKAILFLLLMLIIFSNQLCQAQSIEISDPKLELRDNNLLIFYDILISDPSSTDEFTVSIQITDENGQEIAANSLTGDIGDKVSGGNNKQIIWDLTADNIVMNARIFVKVFASLNAPPESDLPETQQEIADQIQEMDPDENTRTAEQAMVDDPMDTEMLLPAEVSGFNRTWIILQSIPLPGLGLSRTTGKPHWIKGLVGYGCIGGSIALNRMAINSYAQIPDYLDWDDKNNLFEQSQRQDQISEVLAFTAVGIWVADMIWTVVGTSDLTGRSLYGDLPGFSFRTTYDTQSHLPLVGFRYVF